jgi:hypothetical protein
MPETRCLSVGITLNTALDPQDVHLRILAAVSDLSGVQITDSRVIDLDEIDTSPEVQLVVCPVRGLLAAMVDDEGRATDLAKREGAVVINWGADADYRGEVTA